MEWFLFLACCVLAAWCFTLSRRLSEAERRIETLLRTDLATPAHVTRLEERVGRLAYPSTPLPPTAETAFPIVPSGETLPGTAFGTPPFESAPSVPAPPARERLRALLGNEEWEALVGGSLLNKAGAVIFVIGLALLLAYSFAHVGAAGRASLAFLASIGLLAAGVIVERRDRYRTFARGLIGAGWAGLYATAYAIYAIPGARVVENPFAGSLGLLAVAAGIIGHSLRYRSQAVTATACFAAFAALAATPLTLFAVVSLIPLAASLLYLATRFNWSAMALFGLAATYGTCAARGSSDAALGEVQPLFLVYWLLFDGFDLLRMKRRLLDRFTDLIFPLNLIGFLGLSYAAWSMKDPDRLWVAAALGAGLFFADSMVRIKVRPASTFDRGAGLAERLAAGSYEGSVLVSALLAGLAIAGRVQGLWSSAALAVEAELLYLAGIRFDSVFLRRLGVPGFIASLARVAAADSGGTTVVLGVAIRDLTPALLFHAALFYLNRAMRRPNAIMSWSAALLLAIVILLEAPVAFAGSAWAWLGIVLASAGLRFNAIEFRWQAYTLLAAATLHSSLQSDWRALAITLAAVYLSAVGPRWVAAIPERRHVESVAAAASCILAALLVWHATPDPYIGLAECGLALVVLISGLARVPEPLRYGYGPLAVFAAVALALTHASDFAKFPARAVSISYIGASIAAWIAGAIWTVAVRPGELPGERELMQHGSMSLATTATVAAVWLLTPDPWICAVWTAIALALLAAGIRVPAGPARVQAYVAGGLVLAWALLNDIEPAHLAPAMSAAAGLYLAQVIARGAPERRAAVLFSVLGTLLTTAIVFGEASGGLLTTFWGLEGLALLAAGFLVRERILRIQGLAMLLVCILKVFFYDLRNLETIYRILSFIVLGLILLAVSWIYTRFREHVQRLL